MSNDIHSKELQREQPKKTNYILAGIIAGLLVLGLIAYVVAMQMRSPVTESVQVDAPVGAPVLDVPPPQAPPTQPVTPAPAPEARQPEERPKAPPEVVRYINFVKQVNDYRYGLQKAQEREITAAATEELFKALGVEGGSSTQNLVEAWVKVWRWFTSVQPPAECVAIRDSFQTALLSSAIGVDRSLKAFGQLESGDALSLARDLRATSVDVDTRYNTANTELQKILRKYPELPQFELKPDPPGESLLPKGFPLGGLPQ